MVLANSSSVARSNYYSLGKPGERDKCNSCSKIQKGGEESTLQEKHTDSEPCQWHGHRLMLIGPINFGDLETLLCPP
jgi:NMD protein affecting ribosome stability and mRNA decay